jgi:hypothetical protein
MQNRQCRITHATARHPLATREACAGQYPGEKEITFPPFTCLESHGDARLERDSKGNEVIIFPLKVFFHLPPFFPPAPSLFLTHLSSTHPLSVPTFPPSLAPAPFSLHLLSLGAGAASRLGAFGVLWWGWRSTAASCRALPSILTNVSKRGVATSISDSKHYRNLHCSVSVDSSFLLDSSEETA